jgi:hypothetical protein
MLQPSTAVSTSRGVVGPAPVQMVDAAQELSRERGK